MRRPFSAAALLWAAWVRGAEAACAVADFSLMHTLSPQVQDTTRALASVPAASNSGTGLLVAGGEDQKLRVWSLSGSAGSITASLTNTLGSVHGTIWDLVWIDSQSLLASGSGDGFIRLWPLSVLNTQQACHVEALGNGNALCCDGDGLGCEGASVVSWRDAGMPSSSQVHAIAWIESQSILASAWGDGVVRLWTYNAANTPPLAYRNSLSPTGRAYSLGWLTTPSQLAVASPDWPDPELWDKDGTTSAATTLTDSGGCPFSHCGGVHTSGAKSDGTVVATGSQDGKVKLWTASTGAVAHTVDMGAIVTSLAWADSDAKLLSGDESGNIMRWDPADTGTTAAKQTLVAHTSKVTRLLWMGSVDTLASASADLTIKLWKCTA